MTKYMSPPLSICQSIFKTDTSIYLSVYSFDIYVNASVYISTSLIITHD